MKTLITLCKISYDFLLSNFQKYINTTWKPEIQAEAD